MRGTRSRQAVSASLVAFLNVDEHERSPGTREIKARPKEFETVVLGRESGMEKLLVEQCSPSPRVSQAPQGRRGQPGPEKHLLDQGDKNRASL